MINGLAKNIKGIKRFRIVLSFLNTVGESLYE